MKHLSNRKVAWLVIALPAVFVILSALIVTAVHGEAAAEKIPTGGEILDRHIEVTGGLKAYDALRNRKSVSKLDIPSQGMVFDMTVWTQRPNSVYSVVENPALGKIEKGVSGGVVWEKSIMTGPVIKTGPERDAAIMDSTFERFVYWRDSYLAAEMTGEETVAGADCWKVVLTPAKTREVTLFFDKESGLIRKIDTVADTEMGSIPVEVFLSDYREQDGIMIAFKATIRVLGQERIFTTTSIEHNVEMPEGIFDIPDDVKVLQE